MFKIKEFYKTVNQIGRWLHRPVIILRFATENEEYIEMSIDDIINILKKMGDFWVLIKGHDNIAPQDIDGITMLLRRIKEDTKMFTFVYTDALKSTLHLADYIDYLELVIKEPTQQALNKIPTLHKRIGDCIVYLYGRSIPEIAPTLNLNYPQELGLLFALPKEDASYIARAMDLTRIAYVLPSSRWATTVRAYTIFKDGGYFPERMTSLIKRLMGKASENFNYKRKKDLITNSEVL